MSYCPKCLDNTATTVDRQTRYVSVKRAIKDRNGNTVGHVEDKEPQIVSNYYCASCQSLLEFPQADSFSVYRKLKRHEQGRWFTFPLGCLLFLAGGAVGGFFAGPFGAIIAAAISAWLGTFLLKLILPSIFVSSLGILMETAFFGLIAGVVGALLFLVCGLFLNFDDKTPVLVTGFIAGAVIGAWRVLTKHQKKHSSLQTMESHHQAQNAEDDRNITSQTQHPQDTTQARPVPPPLPVKAIPPPLPAKVVSSPSPKHITPATQPTHDNSLANELTKLKALHESGVLDDEEYRLAKKKILAA